MDNTNENPYIAYCLSRSAAESELDSLIHDYEDEYFADMCLLPDSIVRQYVQFQSNPKEGTWINDSDDYELGLFDKDDFYIRIRKLPDGVAGLFNSQTNEMQLSPSEAQNKSVILHEMIHAHEFNLFNLPTFFRDFVMLCLYNDLLPKIPNLDNRIIAHTHVIPGNRITAEGGNHGILFFLKSLDLDLRCGYKLGTVCGYGRDEM